MSTETQPPREAAFFTAIRNWGITRGRDGVFGGVVQGVGERIGMAHVPARIIVVVLALILNGLVLIAYGAAWGLLPDKDGNIIIQNFGRGVTNVGALIGIALFTLIGLGSLDGHHWLWGPSAAIVSVPGDGGTAVRVIALVFGILFPLAVLGGIVWLIVYLVKRNDAASPPLTATTAQPEARGKGSSAASAAAPVAESPVAAPPVAAPRPPRPPMPYVPGPGRGGYLGALAMILIAIAAVWWTSRIGELAVSPLAAWFALWLVGLGLILALVSATGRKQGFLGFISVPLVILGIVGAFYGEHMRDVYHNAQDFILQPPVVAEDPDWIDEDYDSTVVDPTGYFEDDYLTMVFVPECFAGKPWDVDEVGPVTRVRYGVLTENTEVPVTAPATEVTVPANTSLVLHADGFTQSVVYWPERNIWCDFWDGDGTNAALLNPGAPVLTLTVFDDTHGNMIIINEVETP